MTDALDPVRANAGSAPLCSTAEGPGLAHDAGNLLGALGLYCDLLRAPGVLRPEHIHYANELSLISSRSSVLIRRLLSSTEAPSASAVCAANPATPCTSNAPMRRRSVSTQPARQPADVRRSPAAADPSRPGLLHASVLPNLAPVLERIAAGAARVIVVAPAMLPPLDLAVETLERIAVNLVRNAAEAIRLQRGTRARLNGPSPLGEIRVALNIVGGRLQLTVEDNGPGLPPAAAAAFLRPSPLPPQAVSGHGHRIVHELLTASGGQLSLRVRPGKGTSFCLKWPLPAALPGPAEVSTPHVLPSSPLFHPSEHVSAHRLSARACSAEQKGLHAC